MKNEELTTLIMSYKRHQTESSRIKKEMGEENESIKNELLERKTSEFVAGDITVKRTVVDKSYFDNDRLLATIRKLDREDLVELVPTVNMEKLEDAIYKQTLSKEELLEISKCKVPKEEVRLTLSKTKKVEDE